jgi:heme-degrading monooxygenase HmoA
VIARVWKARATKAGAGDYARHFSDRVVPELKRIAGYRRAALLQELHSDQPEIIVVTWWESEESIRRFAGADMARAVVADEAKRVLMSFDDTVRHYSVVEEAGGSHASEGRA